MQLVPDGRTRPVALVTTLYANILDAFRSLQPPMPADEASWSVQDIRRGRPASVERWLLGIDEQLAKGGPADAADEVSRRFARAVSILKERHEPTRPARAARALTPLVAIELEFRSEAAGATADARVLVAPMSIDACNAAIAAGYAEIHATASKVQALEYYKDTLLLGRAGRVA